MDDRVDRALRAGFNVLIGARRGAGATTLLNRLEGELADSVPVNAAEASDPSEVIQAVAARAGIPREILGELAAPFRRIDPLAVPRALGDIARALRAEDRRLTVLLDGPMDPRLAHTLFGRLRDALFALPVTWAVVGHDDRLAEYLTPPADVFFEAVERIEDLGDHDVDRLLMLRNAGALVETAGNPIKDAQDGTPRHVLALARAMLLRLEDHADDIDRYSQAAAGLSRGAATLLSELQGRGPATATDSHLLQRLGVTDRHLRRALAELEDAGLVEPVPGGRAGPGRPAKTFRLTPVGAYVPRTSSAESKDSA